MAANLMGFHKIKDLPPRPHRGVYDDLLEAVASSADMYALDTKDAKRTASLGATLRNRAKKLGLPVKVIKRGTTVIVVRSTPIVTERVEGGQDD